MSFSKIAIHLAVSVSLVSILLPVVASAQKFPTKPIDVIIPFQPGDTDNLLRPFLEKMGEFLGKPVNLVYRPGAAGGVGATFVAKSKPDGYTLLGTSHSSVVVVPLTNKQIAYDLDSFIPIASMVASSSMIVVPADSPWKTFQELVEYSKNNPGKLTYTSSGTFGVNHLIPEAISKEAGVKWTHIPSQGSGPAITAVLGGHIKMAATAIGPAKAHLEAGTLRPLVSFGHQRMKAFPNVPTLKELGYSISTTSYYGILAPKGTPREAVDALYDAAKKSVETYNKQISDRLDVFGVEIGFLPPKEYLDYLTKQKELFSGIHKELSK